MVGRGSLIGRSLLLLTCAPVDDVIGTRRCYITTANVDGEANLKVRTALEVTKALTPRQLVAPIGDNAATINSGGLAVKCGPPSPDLYSFTGLLQMGKDGCNGVHAIDTTQLLLKGSVLKNGAVHAVACYTGNQAKIALSQRPAASKVSSAERRLNGFLFIMLTIMVSLCAASATLKYAYDRYAITFVYAQLRSTPDYDSNGEDFWTWFGWRLWDFLEFLILFSNLIPISLYVTLELQKLMGALLITWDLELYDRDQDEPIQARCSDLNEELGQVEHIFADKTGTLTQNIMASVS